MLFIVHHLAALGVYAMAAWALGDWLLDRWIDLFDDPLERSTLAILLGFGGLAQALFVLGLVGGYHAPVVIALLTTLLLMRWRSLGAALEGLQTRIADIGPWRCLGFTVALAPPLVLALYPPTGYDANVYHLPFVDHFLDAGRLVFVESLRFPIFPQVGEMGFLGMTMLSSDVGAKMSQVPMLWITAALLVLTGRRLAAPWIGWWAAMLWLGNPLALWIGSKAYVDVGLSAFVTGALYAAQRWWATDDRRWAVLCGASVGLAAGTKYLGLFFFGVLAALFAVDTLRRHRWAPTLAFGLAFLVLAGPWYLRIWVTTGNPVFPFYSAVFGESEWQSWHDRTLARSVDARSIAQSAEGSPSAADRPKASPTVGILEVLEQQGTKVVSGLGFLVRVPWTSLFERQIFKRQAPLTPWYLLLLPWALPLALLRLTPGRRGSPEVAALTLLVGVYSLFWLTTVRDLRFLLPVMPALNLVLAHGVGAVIGTVARRAELRPRHVAVALVVAFCMPGWLYGLHKIGRQGAIPTSPDARQAYLTEHLPGHGLLPHLRTLEPGAVYGLYAAHLRYHADRPFRGDLFGPYAYRHLRRARHGDRLHSVLERFGCRYLIVPHEVFHLRDDPAFHRIYEPMLHHGEYTLYGPRRP